MKIQELLAGGNYYGCRLNNGIFNGVAQCSTEFICQKKSHPVQAEFSAFIRSAEQRPEVIISSLSSATTTQPLRITSCCVA